MRWIQGIFGPLLYTWLRTYLVRVYTRLGSKALGTMVAKTWDMIFLIRVSEIKQYSVKLNISGRFAQSIGGGGLNRKRFKICRLEFQEVTEEKRCTFAQSRLSAVWAKLSMTAIQPDAVDKQRGPRLLAGKQESKQRTNLFTRTRDFIQYARLWKEEHFLDYCDRKQQKQCLLK